MRLERGRQIVFCRRNETLHLTEDDLDADGTYTMGRFLGHYCAERCAPEREPHVPCPLFFREDYESNDGMLAAVKMNGAQPECFGVRYVLDEIIGDNEPERFFFWNYIRFGISRCSFPIQLATARWNERWLPVHEHRAARPESPRNLFENMIWSLFTFPALVPQVWLNWLNATEPEYEAALQENPSRVDFVAFVRRQRHVIEIDGPSHYADWNGQSYRVDERAYARNLKIERSLRNHGWPVARIGRVEVTDLKRDDISSKELFPALEGFLPFNVGRGAPVTSYDQFGLAPLDRDWNPDDEIPF